MDISDRMKSLVDDTVRVKKNAQAIAAFLKTGRARQFVESAYAMEGDTVTVYSYTWSACLQLSIYVKNLEGFKDERLAGILQAWEYFNPIHTRMTEDAGAFTKNFTFSYSAPHDENNNVTPSIEVLVSAQIKNESVTCKRVVIGMTDPKPQPLYKLVCEGEVDPTEVVDEAVEG